MKCPNCEDTRLEVTHVFGAGDSAETRNLKCRECGFKASSVTFLVDRPQERRKGKGAWALSKKIRLGEIKHPMSD